MGEKAEEWIEVAQGEDGIITHWESEFAPVMDRIQGYVSLIADDGPEVDWSQVCLRVPGLKSRDVSIDPDSPWETFLAFLELDMDCAVTEEEWDGGAVVTAAKWSDLFRRMSGHRFSLKGARKHLYDRERYKGGHEQLDQIILILGKEGIDSVVHETDSPLNVSTFEYVYHFKDGGFRIYSGNYLFGPHRQGAYVEGFDALRWLLNQFGIAQPRRFKDEQPRCI